jgi:hypothetical protein
MFVIHLHAKFHMPSSSGSLLLTIKPKPKWRLRAAAMLSYSIEKQYQNKSYTVVCLGSTLEVNSSLRARSLPPYINLVDCENLCSVYPRFSELIGGGMSDTAESTYSSQTGATVIQDSNFPINSNFYFTLRFVSFFFF